MKKLILIALCSGLMAFGSAGSAGAYTMIESETAHIYFNIPSDFNDVFGALLSISAITFGGDKVEVEGTLIGELNTSHPKKHANTTTFDLMDFFATYTPNGPSLDVTVTAAGPLTLDSSMLTLQYVGSTDYPPNGNNAPVPEPAALLLLGSGLSGLAFWGKRRRVTV